MMIVNFSAILIFHDQEFVRHFCFFHLVHAVSVCVSLSWCCHQWWVGDLGGELGP